MLGYRAPHLATAEELELAGVFAGHAGLAIENARVDEQLAQRHRVLQALYHADEALHRSLRLSDVLEALVDVATALLHAEAAARWDPDPQREGRLRRWQRAASASSISRTPWR